MTSIVAVFRRGDDHEQFSCGSREAGLISICAAA
jgi:hypothetical protein